MAVTPIDEEHAPATVGRGYRCRQALACLAIALGAGLLVLAFCSPRYVYWRGLSIPGAKQMPEFGRALATLKQLDDPWAPISEPLFLVLSWRLLFPLIWYYCALPKYLLLAMPPVGCVLALWLTAWLSWQRVRSWTVTFLATVLFAALPWFFVSTGWLGYFDSWLVLGLVTVAFIPSRTALVVAGLLTPWIDERFYFALPTCLVVRAAALGYVQEKRFRAWCGDGLVVVAACLPYVLLRLVAWLSGDGGTDAYVELHQNLVTDVPMIAFGYGLWSGYRAAWGMLIAAPILWSQRVGTGWGMVLAVVSVTSVLVSLTIAADMSRSTMIICPLLLLGIWLWEDARRDAYGLILPIVVVLNLLFPAAHVMWGFVLPIPGVRGAIEEWRDPPAFIMAAELINEAELLIKQGNLAEGHRKLDEALRLDNEYPTAHLLRAMLDIPQGRLSQAARDVDQALVFAPTEPYAWHMRGVVNLAREDHSAASADFRRALQLAPPHWARRAEAEQLLQEALQKSTSKDYP